MIISLRGTHGSGKSTVVKILLDRYESSVESCDSKGKPNGYLVRAPLLNTPLYVVGSYLTACGGCDGIQPYSLIWPRVVAYAELGHVLFEGALVSSSYGNIGRASEVYGDDMVFCFMDTPVDKCIQRIKLRRESKGNTKPLNPSNTIKKNDNVLRSIDKIRDVYKRRVVILDHRKAVGQLLGVFRDAESS